jgi:hypothetical protein
MANVQQRSKQAYRPGLIFLSISVICVGWLSIGIALFLQGYKNHLSTSAIQAGHFDIRDSFDKGFDSSIWKETSVEALGKTCLYPQAWALQPGMLVLPVIERTSLCFSRPRPYRGSIICSRNRFQPPFSVTARLKMASGQGVVSSLYTYTDPDDGNPHFESDFEFPSKSQNHHIVWINQFSPTTKHPLFGDPHGNFLSQNFSKSFNTFSIEVYLRKTVFRMNGLIIENRTLSQDTYPQRVCLNSWFAARWQNLYKGAEFKDGFDPYKIAWVEVKDIVAEAP